MTALTIPETAAGTCELVRTTDSREIGMAATMLFDPHAWAMLEHWLDVPAPEKDTTAFEVSSRQRLLVGSVWASLDLLARDGHENWLVLVDRRRAGLRWIAPTRHPQVYTTGGFVAAEHRGRGVGGYALATLTERCVELGAGFVSTATRADNHAASANLLARGYVRTPQLEDPDRDREHGKPVMHVYTFAAAGNDPRDCPVWRRS